MRKISCIIIDDEKPAQDILTHFVSRVEWLQLSGVFDNIIPVLEFLKNNEPELIFLDLQMPTISGMDFLKISRNLPQVIITTAYSQYAVEAFDLDVRDYLLKPFSFERFVKALNRLTILPDEKQLTQTGGHMTHDDRFMFFNMNKTMIKVRFEDVLYVESMREYIYIHTSTGKVITKLGIGEAERILGPAFLRVHRSFVVNENRITSFNAEEVFVDKISLPIGPNYRKIIEATLSAKSIR